MAEGDLKQQAEATAAAEFNDMMLSPAGYLTVKLLDRDKSTGLPVNVEAIGLVMQHLAVTTTTETSRKSLQQAGQEFNKPLGSLNAIQPELADIWKKSLPSDQSPDYSGLNPEQRSHFQKVVPIVDRALQDPQLRERLKASLLNNPANNKQESSDPLEAMSHDIIEAIFAPTATAPNPQTAAAPQSAPAAAPPVTSSAPVDPTPDAQISAVAAAPAAPVLPTPSPAPQPTAAVASRENAGEIGPLAGPVLWGTAGVVTAGVVYNKYLSPGAEDLRVATRNIMVERGYPFEPTMRERMHDRFTSLFSTKGAPVMPTETPIAPTHAETVESAAPKPETTSAQNTSAQERSARLAARAQERETRASVRLARASQGPSGGGATHAEPHAEAHATGPTGASEPARLKRNPGRMPDPDVEAYKRAQEAQDAERAARVKAAPAGGTGTAPTSAPAGGTVAGTAPASAPKNFGEQKVPGSTAAGAAGAAEGGVAAGEGSFIRKAAGWGLRRLALPVAVTAALYEAGKDALNGDFRSATTHAAGGLSAVGLGWGGYVLGAGVAVAALPVSASALAVTAVGVGAGLVTGYFAGSLGSDLGAKAGELAYDKIAGPPAAGTKPSGTTTDAGLTPTEAGAKPDAAPPAEPSWFDKFMPNGLKNTGIKSLSWGALLGGALGIATRNPRLALLGAGTGVAAGTAIGLPEDVKEEKAKVEAAANPATAKKPAAKKDGDPDGEPKYNPANEDDGWIKKALKGLVMVLSFFLAKDTAKSIGKFFGDFLGIKLDDEPHAAGASAAKGEPGTILGVNLTQASAPGVKAELAAAQPNTPEEMRAMMGLIERPENKMLMDKFAATMRAHSMSDLGAFMQFGDVAEKAMTGDQTAKAALPGMLLELMDGNPQRTKRGNPDLKNDLNRDIIPTLRAQYHAEIAAHNETARQEALARAPAATTAPVTGALASAGGVQPAGNVGISTIAPGGATPVAATPETTLPPSRTEMQILLTELRKPGRQELQGKLDDMIADHGFSAFQRRSEQPFTEYQTLRNIVADQTGKKVTPQEQAEAAAKLPDALLAVVEKFPGFDKQLYQEVMPGVLGADKTPTAQQRTLQQIRALDTLMQPEQKDKMQAFMATVSDRAGDATMTSIIGGDGSRWHRELLEAGKRVNEGQPGVKENMPDILAKLASVDPAVEKSLLKLADSVPRKPFDTGITYQATVLQPGITSAGKAPVAAISRSNHAYSFTIDGDTFSKIGGAIKDWMGNLTSSPATAEAGTIPQGRAAASSVRYEQMKQQIPFGAPVHTDAATIPVAVQAGQKPLRGTPIAPQFGMEQ